MLWINHIGKEKEKEGLEKNPQLTQLDEQVVALYCIGCLKTSI